MKEVLLQGDKKDILDFISSIPEELKNEWKLEKVNDKNYDYIYLGEEYPHFRITLIVIGEEYNLKWVIPIDENITMFEEIVANKCMEYFLNKFDCYAKRFNISFRVNNNM